MKKFLLFLLPIIGLILAGASITQFIAPLSPGIIKSSISAVLGIIFSIMIYFFIEYLFKKTSIKKFFGLELKNVLLGVILGLIVSFSCGISFILTHKFPIQFSLLSVNLPIRFLNNFTPALLEEIVFRHGIVHAGFLIFSERIALLLGSIPFGVLHLIGLFFGQSVGFTQVVGISLGGLLLSLTYLQWGLAAAIGLHLIWNSLSVQWAQALGLGLKDGPALLEGSPSTIFVLAIMCLILISFRRRQKENKNLQSDRVK